MKKDTTKYYYIYVIYDIKEERVNKVFKICKKYLNHYQNSVFKGEISPANILKLKSEMNAVINENEDTITILKFLKKDYVKEEEIGKSKDSGNFL